MTIVIEPNKFCGVCSFKSTKKSFKRTKTIMNNRLNKIEKRALTLNGKVVKQTVTFYFDNFFIRLFLRPKRGKSD